MDTQERKAHEFNEMYGRFLDTSGIEHKVKDLRYGPYERNLLDIYYPDGLDDMSGERLPLILFFHGGAFMRGDKGRYQLKPALSGIDHGFAVASANYRFASTDELPAAVKDAKCAVRYLKAHADELHIDPERVAVWGESAGATLANLIGLSVGVPALEDLSMGWGNESSSVRAVVDWYAPVDMKQGELERRRSGDPGFIIDGRQAGMVVFDRDGTKTDDEVFAAMDQMNVLRYVGDGRELPAMFIEQGTDDQFVSPEQSQELYEALRPLMPEDKLRFKLVKGGHHGVADYETPENIAEIMTFLRANV